MRLLGLLLLPFTVTGSLLGLVYAVTSGKHPSPRLLMWLGFFGFPLLVALILRVTIFGG